MDFNIALSIEGKMLVAGASSPLGEACGRSAWPRNDELELGAHELGERLFHRLLPGAVQSLYHRCRGSLASRAGQLRLRVRGHAGADNQELARIHAIPWELVRDPHEEGFLSLDPQVQLVRYLNLPSAVPGAFQVGSRELEVLIAVASPADQERLRWEAESAIIERAFAGSPVRVTILRHATLERLHDALARQSYDVLHFIGHGDGPTGTLALETERGTSDWITAQQLALATRVTTSLRLVFLNACSTAELAARSHKNLASSVGPALALGGVPGVVAMTSAIRDSEAITFARSVYSRLRDGASIEAAVHAARIAMRLGQGHGQGHGQSWTIPVVFSRMAAGHVAEDQSSIERAPRPHASVRITADTLNVPNGTIASRETEGTVDPDLGNSEVIIDAKHITGEALKIIGAIHHGPERRGSR